MILQFPYQPIPLLGPPPPSAPLSAAHERPFVRVILHSATGQSRHFHRVLLDPGSDDTIFPLAMASRMSVTLRPDSGHRLRWGGQPYPLRFGDVQLEITDGVSTARWPAVIGFSDAPLAYRLLGMRGCLQFFDATFRGADRIVELTINRTYPGIIS